MNNAKNTSKLLVKPVILCIGTPSVSGDSLGPAVGDILINDYNVNAYVYGNTKVPVNGLNYNKFLSLIKTHHRKSVIIAVDACLGEKNDVGKIKYTLSGLRAGAALNRNFDKVGDIGILGVVGEKSKDNFLALASVNRADISVLCKKIAEKIFRIVDDMISF